MRRVAEIFSLHLVSLVAALFGGGMWLASVRGGSLAVESSLVLPIDTGFEVLRQLDREDLSQRLSTLPPCPTTLSPSEALRLFRSMGEPEPDAGALEEIGGVLDQAKACDLRDVELVLIDEKKTAAVDALYRTLLGRPADVLAKLKYGSWLDRGLSIEAVARDVVASTEFQILRSLGER